MTEAEWLVCKDASEMLPLQRRKSNSRKLRLFASNCVRCVWELLSPGQFREAVEVAERFADDAKMEKRRAALRSRCMRHLNTPFSNTNPWVKPEVSTASLAATTCLVPEAYQAALESSWYAALAGARTQSAKGRIWMRARAEQAILLRDIFWVPFQKPKCNKKWRTDTVVTLARTMYASRDFSAMPILADALQDAGCDSDDVLEHCRGPGPHVRGCWVVDAVLDKE